MSAIFGGSKNSSSQNSYNRSYDQINSTFSPVTSNAATGSNALSQLLSGDSTGFDAYKKATGFDANAEYGSRGITGNAAASGLLRSGSTGRALQAYGDQIQDQSASSYLDKLLQQAGLGFQAGSLISGAGNVSKGTSSGSSKPGLGGFLGQLGSGIAASDRRLKKNIFRTSEKVKDVDVYQFRYLDGSGPYIGVMADEVQSKYPEALGPTFEGYQSVDYSRLTEGVRD